MEPTQTENPPPKSVRGKLLVLVAVVATFGLAFYFFGDLFSLQKLANQEADLIQYKNDHPWVVYGIAFLVYVAVTGLSLPGAATVMTLLLGWLFGFWHAVLVVSFASTAGASVAFLLSRYLMRDAILKRFGSRLESFNEALKKEGAFYLFTLRLMPNVPFFAINVVMGLTPIALRTFWWVSQLGMLPGTAVYVYAGSSLNTGAGSLQTLADKGITGILSTQLIVAFILLGIFPLIIRYTFPHIRKKLGYAQP